MFSKYYLLNTDRGWSVIDTSGAAVLILTVPLHVMLYMLVVDDVASPAKIIGLGK